MMSVGLGGRLRIIATAGVLAASMAAAGCGEAEYTYVSNTDDKAYFKVPSGWSEADVKPVDDYFAWSIFDVEPDSATRDRVDQIFWSAVYDAAEEPTGHHMVTSYPTGEPVAYSLVMHMPESLRGPVSLDYLRNMFLPVTDSVRAAYDQAGDSGLSGFELLQDEVLTPADGHPRGPRRLQLPALERCGAHDRPDRARQQRLERPLPLVDPLHSQLLPGTRG